MEGVRRDTCMNHRPTGSNLQLHTSGSVDCLSGSWVQLGKYKG